MKRKWLRNLVIFSLMWLDIFGRAVRTLPTAIALLCTVGLLFVPEVLTERALWLQSATPDQVIAFLQNVLEASLIVSFTMVVASRILQGGRSISVPVFANTGEGHPPWIIPSEDTHEIQYQKTRQDAS